MEDSLFNAIQAAAIKNHATVPLLIISILEGTFYDHPTFNYPAALQKLIEEAQARPVGEFTMTDLPSFSELCVSTAENGYVQPATLRARLGKAFNAAVRHHSVPGVSRATTQRNGKTELKFLARAAVYVRN